MAFVTNHTGISLEHDCITRLVLQAGKYIANDDYTNGHAKLKRHSTRHVSEVTAIASKFGNSAKIIVPRSWLRKRVIAFLHSEFISKHPEQVNENGK